jgi:formylglycine-generating enzyme
MGRNGDLGSQSHVASPAPAGPRGALAYIRGGHSFVGTDVPVICLDGEGPQRKVTLDDFVMETETVTVGQFQAFIEATGYRTEAERIGSAAVFVGLLSGPGSQITRVPNTPWWAMVDGANWKEPEGPGSSIADRWDHPVTQVSWSDALCGLGRWPPAE